MYKIITKNRVFVVWWLKCEPKNKNGGFYAFCVCFLTLKLIILHIGIWNKQQ